MIDELLRETTQLLLDKSQPEIVKKNLKKLQDLLLEKEYELERLEQQNIDTSEAERELLDFNKRFERLDQMAMTMGDAVIPVEDKYEQLNNHELIQLHERIIEQQDTQLDSLADLLHKHKQIGEMISHELDTQVELLDEVQERVDNTHTNMNRGMRRMDSVLESRESKSFCLMLVLFLILFVVILLTRLI
jgi:syntaxin 8